MTQSNEQGGDVPTGLDEAVRTFSGYVRGENGFDELDFKEWLIEWHNKQVEAALDRLQANIDDGKKSHSMAVVRGAIEAERKKLKEK